MNAKALRWSVVLGVLFLLVLAAVAAGGPAPRKTKLTSGTVGALAMDGPQVAYDIPSAVGRPCNRVFVWNVLTGKTMQVSGKGTCGADSTSTGAGVRELAIAGARVAWIVNQGGNSESDDYLYTSSLPKPNERKLASAIRTGEVTGVLTCGGDHGRGLAGTWIGCLVGAGRFLAVNRWSTDTNDNVSSARLETIGAGLRTIASGAGAMDAVSTDGKQVAVLRANGSIGLFSTGGKLLRTVIPTSAKEIAVRGDYLAVLTKANRLALYNSHSGRLLHAWPVAKGATYLDVSSKLAAYAAFRPGGWNLRVVHVLSLPNGKDHVLAHTSTTRQRIVGVQLEPTGLVYAVGTGGPGYLVFTPMSRLPR